MVTLVSAILREECGCRKIGGQTNNKGTDSFLVFLWRINKIISDCTESFVSGYSGLLMENENIRAEVKRKRSHLIRRIGGKLNGGEPMAVKLSMYDEVTSLQ